MTTAHKNSNPILLFSGGLDSTTLLWQLKPNVKCLSFSYGQRHTKELECAIALCNELMIEHEVCDLGIPIHQRHNWKSVEDLIHSGSVSGREEVPHGHYAAESMKSTIVPNRNMIMLAIATGWAVASGSKQVLWAAHAGDHAIYPDCRPEFFFPMREAIIMGNQWTPVELDAPYLYLTKAQIVKQGLEINVPYELSWSCYEGKDKPCGRCGTCVERLEAFALNGVKDLLEYANATS